MKNLLFILLAAAAFSLAACKGSHNKSAADSVDSNAQRNNAAPVSDTINGSSAPFAESTSGSDTSTDGHGVDDPLADTAHSKKH